MPLAGAVVSIDHAGGVVVHRGLLHEEQAKSLRQQGRQAAGKDAEGPDGQADAEPAGPGISEKLARRLSAHRTVALQAEVARHPRVALVAQAHLLAHRVILDGYGGSPINISASPQDRLTHHAPDVEQSPAAVGLREVREPWAARLPSDPKALFAQLLAMPESELLSLLALCVRYTVSAIASQKADTPAAALTRSCAI